MKLSELKTGESAVIVKVAGHGGFRKRIIEMGFIKGKAVEVLLNAPLQDPVKYKIMGYEVSLRHSEADHIEVVSLEEARNNESLNHARKDMLLQVADSQQAESNSTDDKMLEAERRPTACTTSSTWHWWETPTAERPRSSTLHRVRTNA